MHRRQLQLGAFVCAGALLACAHAPPKPPLEWPAPPDKARIRFVTAFQAEEDLERGRWADLMRTVLGGSSSTRIEHPMGLAISDDGERLYIADLRGSQVYVADFKAKKLRPFASDDAFNQPCNVALDAQENVYVSETKASRIVVFSKDGKRLRTFGKEMERPTGLAIDRARGIVYAADTSRSRSENHRVFAYTLEGQLIREIGKGRGTDDGQFNFPSYLAIDAAGNLYVNDAMNFRIQVFDPEGRFVRAYGSPGDTIGSLARTKGIAFDSFGNLYAADGEHSVVQIFTKDFVPLMYFGGKGNIVEHFDIPSAIAIDQKRNRIYVGNEILARVNVYDLVNTTAGEALESPATPPPPAPVAAPAAAAGGK
jgi:DNA-binding beta-propeller fold protein YncE